MSRPGKDNAKCYVRFIAIAVIAYLVFVFCMIAEPGDIGSLLRLSPYDNADRLLLFHVPWLFLPYAFAYTMGMFLDEGLLVYRETISKLPEWVFYLKKGISRSTLALSFAVSAGVPATLILLQQDKINSGIYYDHTPHNGTNYMLVIILTIVWAQLWAAYFTAIEMINYRVPRKKFWQSYRYHCLGICMALLAIFIALKTGNYMETVLLDRKISLLPVLLVPALHLPLSFPATMKAIRNRPEEDAFAHLVRKIKQDIKSKYRIE